MRALALREKGAASTLELTDLPTPEISDPHDVRIALRTAALNHLDLFAIEGIPGLTLEFPHVLGADGAGVVESVGAGVRRVETGDRVLINPGVSCYDCEPCNRGEHSLCVRYSLLGEHLPGTLAEYVIVPEVNVARIPSMPLTMPEISWAEAAGFPLATLTAWRMLTTRARVQNGEVVLIWGIGGGVALAALAVAKLAGAFVIVTSSSDRKLAIARELGADVAWNHSTVDVPREIRKLTEKRGADVVVDNVGEATWQLSLQALAKGGRLVTCGGTSGPMVVSDVRRVFWNQYTIMGSTMGNAAEFAEIVRLLGEGKLRPRIDSVVPLKEGAEAIDRLRQGNQVGKIVVEIRSR